MIGHSGNLDALFYIVLLNCRLIFSKTALSSDYCCCITGMLYLKYDKWNLERLDYAC